MNKLIFGLVGCVVILASCSNPAGNPALGMIPTTAPTQTETTVTTTQYPKKSTVYHEDNSGTHKVDFSSKVDLTGYHEIPKDPEYGINWVYISKSTYDKMLTETNPKYKYVAVRWFDCHYENTLGYVVSCYSSTAKGVEGFYKCIPYLRNDVSSRAPTSGEKFWVLTADKQTLFDDEPSCFYFTYPKTETEIESTKFMGNENHLEKYFPEWKYLEH